MRVSAYPSADHARQIYADVSFLRAANKGWLPPWPVKDIRLEGGLVKRGKEGRWPTRRTVILNRKLFVG